VLDDEMLLDRSWRVEVDGLGAQVNPQHIVRLTTLGCVAARRVGLAGWPSVAWPSMGSVPRFSDPVSMPPGPERADHAAHVSGCWSTVLHGVVGPRLTYGAFALPSSGGVAWHVRLEAGPCYVMASARAVTNGGAPAARGPPRWLQVRPPSWSHSVIGVSPCEGRAAQRVMRTPGW
jgi:hypothetical protein